MQEKLNARIRNILTFLAAQTRPVTLNEIASTLNVSSKTIRRDLAELDSLLGGYDARICRKSGQGIWLYAESAERARVIGDFTGGKKNDIYTPEERRTLIISRLLQNQEPIKLFEFTSLLKVSEATISKDLDKLEEWFAGHQLSLIRRPGLGIYVNGAEKYIRKAIVHYIYENINEEQLIGILHDALAESEPSTASVAVSSSRRLLNLVNTEIIHKLEDAIQKAAQSLNYKLSDRSLIGLVVHLALAVQRMQKNEEIVMEEQFLIRLKGCREFVISSRIAASIEEIFAIKVPESEIGYITMHVMGARNQLSDSGKSAVNKFELVCLARKMIKTVQDTVGCNLIGNEKLLIGLVNHLAPSISRIQLNMEIRNPLLSEMKEKYAELMEVSRQAAAPLEEKLQISLPEQEIAYLAMHFGAAIEEAKIIRRKKYRVAVACPTGVGSSRLLASKVRHEFSRIDVICTVSALRLDKAALATAKIDFILATTPISGAPVEVIQVSSMLTDDDKSAIEEFIRRLDKQETRVAAEETKLNMTERLRRIKNYNEAAVAVIEHFFLEEIESACSVDELIELVSSIAADDVAAKRRIVDSLRCREEINSTVIGEQQLMILHCETTGIISPYFGIIRVAGGISRVNHAAGINVAIAAVMLIPSGGCQEMTELMSFITETIVERLSFSQSIHYDNVFNCKEKLEKIIRDFYIEKNKLILEES